MVVIKIDIRRYIYDLKDIGSVLYDIENYIKQLEKENEQLQEKIERYENILLINDLEDLIEE